MLDKHRSSTDTHSVTESTEPRERTLTDPARVQGAQRSAIARFVEDDNGDLIDIEFECSDHMGLDDFYAILPWPAYDFSTDYDTRCNTCRSLINGIN